MRILTTTTLLAALAFTHAAQSADPKITIKDFYGSYVGVGATRTRGTDHRDRVSSLKIAPMSGGFQIVWSTTIGIWSKSNRRTRVQSLTFRPAGQPRRWRAAENGDPFNKGFLAWARLHGRSLIVYIFAVSPASGELTAAIWRRTLTSTGLSVQFDRIRDARRTRQAFAQIKRTD